MDSGLLFNRSLAFAVGEGEDRGLQCVNNFEV